MNAQLAVLAERPLFSVDGKAFTWGDVVAAAHLRSDWAVLRRRAHEGLACRRRLAASDEEPLPAELAAAQEAFRYKRDLLSGEEMEAWLERWRVTTDEWREHLVRELLRARWSDELDEILARFAIADDAIETAVSVDAICSGALERFAARLAADAALAASTGSQPEAGDRASVLARMQSEAERVRGSLAPDEAIDREIEARRLDWTSIEADVLYLPDEDVAREAAACVGDDGQRLEDVAAQAAIELRALRLLLGEAEPTLAPQLMSARAGDILGPLSSDGSFVLLQVRARVPPTTEDPDLRRRAGELLIARAERREVEGRVDWHDAF